MFEIGLGTGLKMPDILGLRNEDVWEKEVLELNIGKKTIRRIFKIPENLQREILVYTEGKDPKAWLFPGRNGSKGPLSKEHACRVMKRVGEELGLPPVGSSTMRKTFAWNYYKATGDIFYLQNLFNHASPSITYRYIGEKPKRTVKDDQQSRFLLGKDDNGKKRILLLENTLEEIRESLGDSGKNDAFFGRVDCLLTEMEELTENFKRMEKNAADRGSFLFSAAFLFVLQGFFLLYDGLGLRIGDEL